MSDAATMKQQEADAGTTSKDAAPVTAEEPDAKKPKTTDPTRTPEEEAKVQARREANRMHAFKSRQRSKQLLSDLQTTVEQLQKEKSELERHNAVLRAQVDVLHQQNLTLLQNQQQMLLQQQQQQHHQQPAPAPPPRPAAAAPTAAQNWTGSAVPTLNNLLQNNPMIMAAAAAMQQQQQQQQQDTGADPTPFQGNV